MIRYIKDPNRETSEGLKMIFIFIAAQFLGQVFRNRYILEGFVTAVRVRRVLVSALYNKVVRLSVKSMTETSSGKLISLISADLFQIERGLSFVAVVVASPIINIAAYIVLGFMIGWWYTFVVVGCWILLMIAQYYTSVLQRTLQG